MTDLLTAEYIASLPEVDTARLPQGTLFFADNHIYQVVEVNPGGFHKARQWRQNESTDVALVPGSFPARHLPLVKRGRILPVYRTRTELTENDRPACFVFPSEGLALDAAYLDVALVQSPGAFVRNQASEPAFAVTDGINTFRLYYYRETAHGRQTNLSTLQKRPLPFYPRPHTAGPGYWRLLPSWREHPQSHLSVTREVSVRKPSMDETLPHIPRQTPPPDHIS